MDKASWNEQWMGYPVGPWYAESSNIDNAHRLEGKLLLIVGEMDTNVPPESTDAAGRRADQGRQGFRAARRPQRQPRHGGRLRPAPAARLLRAAPARTRTTSDRPHVARRHRPSPNGLARPRRPRPTTAASSGGDRALRGGPRQPVAVGCRRPARRSDDDRLRRVHRPAGSTAWTARFRPPQPRRQGRLPALQEPSGARASPARDPRSRAVRVGACWSRSPGRSSISTPPGAS